MSVLGAHERRPRRHRRRRSDRSGPPRGLLLLREDQVPMTGTGKVQKVVLRERLIAEMKQQGVSVVRRA